MPPGGVRAPVARVSRPARLRCERAVGIALAVGLATLAACGTSTSTSTRPAGPSAWQRALDQIGPDGSVSKSTALAAFVLAIGPLPGVPRPAGPAQAIFDGSSAVRWLLEYYSQLTPGQRSAALRMLGLRAPSAQGTGLTSYIARQGGSAGPVPGSAKDLQLERQAVEEIGSRLHVQLTIPVQVFENQTQVRPAGKPAAAYVVTEDAQGRWYGKDPASKCTIFINPSAHSVDDDGQYFHQLMVHEVFHCFEAQLAGSIGNFYRPGVAWLIEGAAEWVASDIVGKDTDARDQWETYLATPTRSLFSRSYDAIGFFGHLYPSEGVSPWSALPAMLRAGSNHAAYKAAGIGEGFLNTEASIFFDSPALGGHWYQHGQQGIPAGIASANVPIPVAKPVPQTTVAQGQTVTLVAPPYTDKVVHLRLTAPATRVTVVYGHARLRSANGRYEDIDPAGELCTTESGKCQGCTPSASPDLLDFGDAGDLALTGGPSGTVFRVTGLSQKDLCELPPKPVDCAGLPDIGFLVDHSFAQDNGFTVLSCQYATAPTGGVPVGFILIETYESPSAAQAAWNRGKISGAAQSGFAVPVLATLSGQQGSGLQRHEFALSGYRIDEIAEIQNPGLNVLPSLDQTNDWMHQLLAAG